MGHIATESVQDKISLEFIHLPAFAGVILRYWLKDFASETLRFYAQTDIPIMRYYQSLDEEEWLARVTASSRDMLTSLAANEPRQYIDHVISSWLGNQYSPIRREQVHSHDITLINYGRGRMLRHFISRYTDDRILTLEIVEEIDRFMVNLNSALVSAHIGIQNQEISDINQALKKRERQLLEAQEVARVGSFEWDLVARKWSITPQILRIFEADNTRDMQAFMDAVHPEDRAKLQKALETAIDTGDYYCEYRYLKNGSEKIILARGKVQFVDGQPTRLVGTAIDITERYQMIEKLKVSERLYKQAQALSHIGNWSWFIRENRFEWSDEMYRICGLAPQSEEITFRRFAAFIHPGDRHDRIRAIHRALETREVHEYQMRIVSAGGDIRILRGKGEVICDQDGEPSVMLGTCQDITNEFMLTGQLRERERYLEELNQSLRDANAQLSRTNEELESFNFIASHDLQEPLRKIQVYGNRILENGLSSLSPEFQDDFGRIINASRRMQKLIEDFLAFSQTFHMHQAPVMVDLKHLLDEVKADLATRIEEKGAQIVSHPLPPVYGPPFHLKQLMINLISNALKYTAPETSPRIVISGGIMNGSPEGVDGADRSVRYSWVSVEDNGIGFDPKYKSKIFELFQRLHNKNEYSGTGIGLALCKKILQNIGGWITVQSEPGKGAVFTFGIPVKPECVASSADNVC